MMYEEEQANPSKGFDEISEIKKRKQFSSREVGINHPDNSAFMRISDSGEIEIFGAPGIGLIINPKTRSISFFADSIKFFCRDDDGLRWNNMSFNPAADAYNEPALVETNSFLNNPAYFRNAHYINNIDNLDNADTQNSTTIKGNYGLGGTLPAAQVEPTGPSISNSEELLILDYSKTHSDSEVLLIRELMENGYKFSDAVQKVRTGNQLPSSDLENFPWIDNDLE
jgi:hypothetical protein